MKYILMMNTMKAGHGVPGWPKKDLQAHIAFMMGLNKELHERLRSMVPLGRMGRPDDVARVVLFCASDLAAFVTATTVFADGGVSAF